MQKTDAGPSPGDVAASACLEPFLEAWAELDKPCEGTVIEVLRHAAQSHRQLLDSVGLENEAPPSWEERSEQLLQYRRKIDADVLTPLDQAYESHGPTSRIEEALGKARDRSVELSRALPTDFDAPWPDDALTREASDSLGRRAGKVLGRVFSKARKAGVERSLPLRNVTLRHLGTVVIPEEDAASADALTQWGRWSRRLEALFDEWVRTGLPALVQADQPVDDEEHMRALSAGIREAAQTLQAGLEQLLEDDPGPELAKAARARLGSARGELESDLAVAGSFLLNPTAPPTGLPELRRVARLAPALQAWDDGVGARISLQLSLLSILSGATAVQRRMVWRFRDRCLSDVPVFADTADRLEGLTAELEDISSRKDLESRLGKLDGAVEKALAPAREAVPAPFTVDSAVREISDSMIDALTAVIRQAPASLDLHAVDSRVPVSGRPAETRTLPLQEFARQSFDALRIERIRASTSGLIEALNQVRTNVEDLGGVYSFAREEAFKVLDESKEDDALEKAVDLVRGALTSTAEALRTQLDALDDAVTAAQDRLASEVSDGSSALLDRVGAGRMEARLFAARSWFTNLRAWINDRWGPPVERAARWLTVRFARIRRLGLRAMRKGSEIVGSTPAETAASARSLRALAEPGASIEGLPLVYQRLFTLEPVSDAALLAGRQSELADAMRRWRRWHDADGVPLILRGRQGSGITSLLKVFASQIENDGGTLGRRTFEDRITTEEALATQLADALGVGPSETLDALSRKIFEADSDVLPAAIVLDNLEHLYLRVPRGTDLLERLLTLMAETEPRVFWIGGITASAWQLVATAEPTAISQVDVIDLEPLSAKALHAAITLRHRRSGLTIRYEEPTAGRHLLRRRLRRMRDPERYHQLLEDDFFDRLQKTSGGHMGLALHQWLVSADFASGDGVLMHQPERPDFSVLDALDLTQDFTLKAFLEHRTLTLEEHDSIFRTSRQESYQIFESLRNRHLLEAVPGDDEDADTRSEIEEDLRYRLSPLLTGAVIAHLKGLNIVH
ncbi:MAG: hypothetical protein PVJ80_03080 [Gemmatimonadota bacterium]|jgi:hypothetical protein